MSDFFQTGGIATLHKLGKNNLDELESRLTRYAKDRPIALVLPSLFSEINGPALQTILNELMTADYISEVVVTLGPASEAEFDMARRFFSPLPQKTCVIWNTGKRMRKLYRAIEGEELPTGSDGKGRSVWMAYGYVLARHEFNAIVLHDCDIVSYSREMLARLCYPVMNPGLDYDFCKGYYARVTDKMHGRVTRLFVAPLIRALQTMIGFHPLLVFFDSFRYILSGEFSMSVNLARINKIPGDWGLEVGTLAEVYKNTSINRVCQVDISDSYEHKHQELSPDDASKGLNRMCIDIAKLIFRTLASEGIVFSDGFFKTLLATYSRTAQDVLKRYEDDASINGLNFDRHMESLSIETFTNGIKIASGVIMKDPLGVSLLSSWDRVIAAVPDILDKICEAVNEDNRKGR